MREGRASRRARRLLVGATLACAVVLCTLAIIDGGARGDAVFVAFSPSSFSFGRRALLQASSSSQSSGNNNSNNDSNNDSNSNSTTTTTNNAGGGAQQSTGEEDKPDSWGGAQTILTLCASGGSFFLSGFNKHKLDKVEVGIRGTNETFLPLCVKYCKCQSCRANTARRRRKYHLLSSNLSMLDVMYVLKVGAY